MPSYRFCRPDDIPFLVQAIDACWHVHFPGARPMTVDRFRTEMKIFDVWPSNAMVAIEGKDPIAVMIGTKRAEEVLIARIGVHPDFQRQGHGRHLLTSLSQKLAVLGPERLIAELPDDLAGADTFFRAAAYQREATYTDWTRPPGAVAPVPAALLAPIGVAELEEQGLLELVTGGVAWRRSRQTLVNRGEGLQAVAFATDRVAAFAIYQPPDDRGRPLDVLAVRVSDASRVELLAGVLLRWIVDTHPGTIRIPRLAEQELPERVLQQLGFVPGRTYGRYAAVATPG